MAMAKIILLLLVLVPIRIRMAAALMDCPDVPSLGAGAACQKACGTKLMYDLCIRMMREVDVDMSPSHTERATAYAILAAHSTAISFDNTTIAMSDQLSQNSSLSSKQRVAYEGCMDDYAPADSSIDTIEEETLPSCHFTFVAAEYTRVITNVEKCRDRLLSPTLVKSPLYPMVLADLNKAVVANMLGKLLGT
uniref:Pectinesterase inhibitor domain-containing protein n=1 Tax=Triticum urartu TaxID=4572 RepID=A0A8R7R7M3_TRIUA